MKTLKNYLFLLLAGTTFLFSACDETEDPFEIVEPEIINQGAPYEIHTLQPDVLADRVIFKGNLHTTDSKVEYGFMWYVKPQGNESTEVTTVPVGTGQIVGEFSINQFDLPRGVDLVVCAYVEYPVSPNSSDVASEIGEEVDFDWDL